MSLFYTNNTPDTNGERFTLSGITPRELQDMHMDSIEIRHGEIVDVLKVQYNNRKTFSYGESNGDERLDVIYLDHDESIVEISGEVGKWYGVQHIWGLKITTDKGKTYGPFGNNRSAFKGVPFKDNVQDQNDLIDPFMKVIGFHGTIAKHTDGIQGIASLGMVVRYHDILDEIERQ